MNPDLLKVLLLLVATIVMFVLNRPRMDVVALLVIAALPLLGVISVTDALAGFADPNVILIALMFVVGEGLVRTGIVQRIGDRLIARAGRNEARLIALLMVAVAGFGSVMSSTGVVAIFIPVARRIASRTGIPARRLMMPLSVAALLSGMMTLIGTPPNLIVQRELIQAGHPGFGFFAFTPFGLPLLGLAIAWMLATSRWFGTPGSTPVSPPPAESAEAPPAATKAPVALATVALMIGLMVTGVVPNVIAALIACLLLGLAGCIDMPSAYRSLHWPTLVLIAGMIPFAEALQQTGGVELAARGLQSGGAGPRALLAAVFVLTALIGLFVSNTATAVLMAPIALTLATDQRLSPYPFVMTVALAASASFMTPVSSPVNTLVVGPGGYRFMDFVRVGVPLALLTLLVTLVLVPWLLPF